MKDQDIVVVSNARTPIGGFGGALKDVPAYDLGAAAIKAALERARLTGDQIDYVLMGNTRQAGNGPNPARTAAVRGGIPVSVSAMTVNMACPSGIKTVMLAARELASGDSRFIVCGGIESMSTIPYLLTNVRWDGFKSGDKVLQDGWNDATDRLCGFGAGITAENQVAKFGISREEQDQFAAESQAKAAAAQAAGYFVDEIVPYHLEPTRKNPDGQVFSVDEVLRPEVTLERLAKLKPAFKKDGTVTAGNACAMGDAGCALIVTTRAIAKAEGLQPLFSVVSFAETAVQPEVMGDGPGAVIPLALKRAGMTLGDMDAIEVNEAFAAQVIANERVLKWDRSKVNQFGGAIALAHPTGFSGGRLLMTLGNILRRKDKEFGVASLCGGGGVTTAMVIRRES
jgi:acetyl-CoA C-acetyltransferase